MSAGLHLASTLSSAGTAFGEMLPWLAGLTVLVVAGGVVIYFLRRSLGRGDTPSEGFTLQDLRDLHAKGSLTEEEFDRARSSLIEHASRTDPDPNDAPSAGSKQ